MNGAADSLRSGRVASQRPSHRNMDCAGGRRVATPPPSPERVRALTKLLIELAGAGDAGKRPKDDNEAGEMARIMKARHAARQSARAHGRQIAWARFAETAKLAALSDGLHADLESRAGKAAEQPEARVAIFRLIYHILRRSNADFYRGMSDGIAALVTWRDECRLRSRIDPSRFKICRMDLEALRGDAMRALQVLAQEGGDAHGQEEPEKGNHATSR